MTEVKLSIKFGAIDLNFEGPQEFVRENLVDFIQRLAALEQPNMVDLAQVNQVGPILDSHNRAVPDAQAKLSTTDFAVKLGVKSGSDLVMAAAAHLHLTRGLEDFRRSDILNEMRAAKSFYKMSYSSNLSKSLETLTKSGRLQNPRTETYALPYNEAQAAKRLLQ